MPGSLPSAGAILVLAATLAGPATALAQSTPAPNAPAPNTAAPATAPATPGATAPAQASPQPGAPQLVVASVKLNGGWRASKLIGAAVYDDQNHKIGSVDDLIMTGQNTVADAILSVGGFLGIGNKLIAVPFDQLRYDPASKDAKVVMQGASKDTLAAMPSFTYAND